MDTRGGGDVTLELLMSVFSRRIVDLQKLILIRGGMYACLLALCFFLSVLLSCSWHCGDVLRNVRSESRTGLLLFLSPQFHQQRKEQNWERWIELCAHWITTWATSKLTSSVRQKPFPKLRYLQQSPRSVLSFPSLKRYSSSSFCSFGFLSFPPSKFFENMFVVFLLLLWVLGHFTK